MDVGEYAEVIGGLQHLAISVEPGRWERLTANLGAEGSTRGARPELITDPLGEM